MANNTISGKVVQKETGLGIPDLLVVVYDLDPGTRPEETSAVLLAAAAPGQMPDGDRLGSVLTDANGAFELSFEDEEFRIRNATERRPDLLLFVMAPEDAGGEPQTRILFASTPVLNAGRIEQRVIRLRAEQLTQAGIRLPTTPAAQAEDPNRVVDRLISADLRTAAVIDGVKTVQKNRVDRVRQATAVFHDSLKPRLQAHLSRVPQSLIDPATFVAPGESVLDKSKAVLVRSIEQLINSPDATVSPPITGFVALTAEQKQALQAQLAPDGSISAEALDQVLDGDKPSSARGKTFLVRQDPLEQFCRERSRSEQESAALLGLGPVPGGGTGSGGGTSSGGDEATETAITDQDIFRFTSRLMDTLTSPEERVVSGLEPRADRGAVETDVQDLSFGPGPADVPAFYDFHNLQIAFEHTWQEAIDEGIIGLSQDAFHQIVELGGDPTRDDGDPLRDPVRGLLQEGKLVMTAQRVVRDHRGDDSTDPAGGVTVSGGGRGAGWGGPVRDHRTGNGSSDPDPLTRLPALLAELEQRLREDYAFTVYAANRKERSINFAILITYRQKWEPLGYQAGKLVKTITLAPKETRRYSKKTVTHRKRMEKEVENHLSSRREEVSETTRAEQEIVRKASTKNNFSLTSEDSVKVPVAEGVEAGSTRTTSFSHEAAKSSDDTKKSFHEAVFKSAQEFKDEHNTEVTTEESEDVEVTESGEITNPNDELALTCLFYELQRRYRVSEKIHRITPVILVAQEVPRPDEIDEAWLITHDWILRRALLDDSFAPALNYLSQNVVGDEIALGETRENVVQQRRIVDELRRELGVVRERLLSYRQLLERSLLTKAVKSSGGGGGLLSSIPVVGDIADSVVHAVEGVAGEVGDFLFGDAGSGQTRQDALKDALDRTADEERDLLFRLEREVTALNGLTEKYSKALAEHFNHRAQIDRLRVHVKQNIFHYMQAIWSYEPPDQRFFRLHKTPVAVLTPKKKTFVFPHFEAVTGSLAVAAHRRLPLNNRPAADLYGFQVKAEFNSQLTFVPLAEVADLDNFLGFKGNYMMFPLKQSNPLTDYMMQPYVVEGFNELVDPDDPGNWTLEEFSRYVLCLKQHLSEEDFGTIREQLQAQYQRLLTNPRPNGDEIIVPTNALFIEAFPGHHQLVGEFKARHRMIDVKKVQAEVRQMELENVRLAARILKGEHEDPTIEKKIVVEGANAQVVVPADQ